MPMVWVISPDPDTQRLIELNLRKRGLQTRAVFLWSTPVPSAPSPVLVILDVAETEEVDWSLADALRSEPSLRQVPLILMAASPPTAGLLNALQPAHWLEKPLDVQVLLPLVWESLAWSSTESDEQARGRVSMR